METLPTELLQEVYKLACTDEGFTGRSLSAVSRRIRDTSLPFKYYSTAVTGLPRMKGLCDALQNHPGEVYIAHLFVGCNDILTPKQRAAKDALVDPFILPRRRRQLMTEEEFHELKTKYLNDINDTEKLIAESETLFMRSLLQVLDMCKHSLRTLSLTLMMSAHVPSFALPNLVELAVTASIADNFFDAFEDGSYPFPSLVRLHLGKSSSNSASLSVLPKSCPRLAHLRIRQSFQLPAQLEALLSTDGLPLLRRVIVDVSPTLDGTQMIIQNHVASRIRRVLVTDSRGSVCMTDVPTVRVAQADWLKTIIGYAPW